MKTLNIYVTSSILSTGAIAIIVLTFGMMGVHLIKIFEYISQGIPVISACMFLVYILPTALAITLPVSILVSVMLIFGRMSADNEITAMRACGISILQIISPTIIIAFLMTCLCLWLQLMIAPEFAAKGRLLVRTVGVKHPLAILEPGRQIEYENLHIMIDDRVGENGLKEVQVYVLSRNRQRIQQDIHASTGRIEVDEKSEIMKIILEKANVVAYENPGQPPRRTYGQELQFTINYGKKFNELSLREKPGYLPLNELFGTTKFYRSIKRETTNLEVELNKRIALGLSPVAFLLIGLPLAIRTSRRETSINLFLSVMLAGIYFISIMIFQAFSSKPEFQPQLLLWIPNVVYQAGGLYYLFRIARS